MQMATLRYVSLIRGVSSVSSGKQGQSFPHANPSPSLPNRGGGSLGRHSTGVGQESRVTKSINASPLDNAPEHLLTLLPHFCLKQLPPFTLYPSSWTHPFALPVLGLPFLPWWSARFATGASRPLQSTATSTRAARPTSSTTPPRPPRPPHPTGHKPTPRANRRVQHRKSDQHQPSSRLPLRNDRPSPTGGRPSKQTAMEGPRQA